MKIPQAPINPGLNNLDQQRWGSVDTLIRVVNALGSWLVLPAEGVKEPVSANNALWLATGAQGGATLSGSRTRVLGASGASFSRTVGFTNTATVNNVNFEAIDGFPTVSLSNTAVVTFVCCNFVNDSADDNMLVKVADGGRAKFVGCTFYGSGLNQVVDNPGAIGNIVFVGCFNLTSAPDGNVTVVG